MLISGDRTDRTDDDWLTITLFLSARAVTKLEADSARMGVTAEDLAIHRLGGYSDADCADCGCTLVKPTQRTLADCLTGD
jgi:hypothetical protein